MHTKELISALKEKNIEVLGQLELFSSKEGIFFLNKLEQVKKETNTLHFINQDLLRLILEIDLNEENLRKIRKTNWEDFHKAFRESRENERKKRIYQNFISFLKAELGLLREEKSLSERSLLGEKEEQKGEQKIRLDLLKARDKFNIEQDQREKRQKYNINVLFDYDEPSHKLSVNDFTLYFNRRLQYFTELLSSRLSMENITRISQLKNLYETNTEVSVIGLISEINETKNGHKIITLEDKSGQINCFINKDKLHLIKQVELLCLDEGIAIRGKVGKEIIWSEEIIIPSPPNSNELKKTEEEHYVAFISDIHFGAKVFVDEAFQKLIDFLNGETQNEELNSIAKKIKHIVLAGDIIEGIGIYPNQGKDARVLSTELQYHEAARWLSQIPKDKSLIIIPGNHDTNRLSEPQPKLPYQKAYPLYNMENTIMLSNPSQIRLFENDPSGGLDFYLYHGGSIFYYADKIQNLREKGGAKVPEEVVKFLLEKRHIAPSHGATLYIPDSQNDPLVIKTMPDFFVVGHTHKLSLANYKGCTIISCGCWVEMSEYQEKMGMFPDIGKCTIVNTKTRKPRIINFYKENYRRVQEEKEK